MILKQSALPKKPREFEEESLVCYVPSDADVPLPGGVHPAHHVSVAASTLLLRPIRDEEFVYSTPTDVPVSALPFLDFDNFIPEDRIVYSLPTGADVRSTRVSRAGSVENSTCMTTNTASSVQMPSDIYIEIGRARVAFPLHTPLQEQPHTQSQRDTIYQ